MSEATRAVTTPAGIEPARAMPDPPEDARGVDLAQLRRNLALTPAERIAAVVEAARAIEPLRAAGAARRPRRGGARAGLAVATLLALALVGCAGAADDAVPDAPAEEPAADAPAEPSVSDAAVATGIVLAGGSLGVAHPGGETVALALDTAPFTDAYAQVTLVVGEPDASGSNADCGVVFATWGGLTLHGDPTSGAVVGWALRAPVPDGVSVLDAEAAIGASRAETLARFSGAADFSDGDTSIGREWTGEGYAGLFSGAADTDTITNLWSGNACIAR